MATLIVDIETVSEEWSTLPALVRTALTHPIEVSKLSEIEKQHKRTIMRERLSLSPFTGSIAALAVHDVERNDTTAYIVTPDRATKVVSETGLRISVCTEPELLEQFWEGARGYNVFVTFNGRAFTFPFLWYRSLVHSVRPTVEVSRQRFLVRQAPPYHVDLLDEFSNYGGMAHRPSLALLSGALGIPNPSVLGGDEVAQAYRAGEYARVAEKAAGDVETISLLYTKWMNGIAPATFLQAIELL
jgi:uncharacterized protein YprB with RNaseH-like and TPR domain